MKDNVGLGDDFEYIVEVNRELKPEPRPEDVLLTPEKYLIRRKATGAEQSNLRELVAFVKDPERKNDSDSDFLRGHAANFDPVVSYLDWRGAMLEATDARRSAAIIDMALERAAVIIEDEGTSLNIMGHSLMIKRNYGDRVNVDRILTFLSKRFPSFHRPRRHRR